MMKMQIDANLQDFNDMTTHAVAHRSETIITNVIAELESLLREAEAVQRLYNSSVEDLMSSLREHENKQMEKKARREQLIAQAASNDAFFLSTHQERSRKKARNDAIAETFKVTKEDWYLNHDNFEQVTAALGRISNVGKVVWFMEDQVRTLFVIEPSWASQALFHWRNPQKPLPRRQPVLRTFRTLKDDAYTDADESRHENQNQNQQSLSWLNRIKSTLGLRKTDPRLRYHHEPEAYHEHVLKNAVVHNRNA